jgi:hypothetical protein
MNIQTIRNNLKNTIAGKEKYLATLGNTRDMNDGAAMATEAVRSMIEINLEELKRILQDVEQCEPSLPGEGNNYEKWDGDE